MFLRLAKKSQFIPLQNVVYFITLTFLVRKIFTFYINDVLLYKCPFPGPKGSRWKLASREDEWFASHLGRNLLGRSWVSSGVGGEQ